jgi:hypothetical protein
MEKRAGGRGDGRPDTSDPTQRGMAWKIKAVCQINGPEVEELTPSVKPVKPINQAHPPRRHTRPSGIRAIPVPSRSANRRPRVETIQALQQKMEIFRQLQRKYRHPSTVTPWPRPWGRFTSVRCPGVAALPPPLPSARSVHPVSDV